MSERRENTRSLTGSGRQDPAAHAPAGSEQEGHAGSLTGGEREPSTRAERRPEDGEAPRPPSVSPAPDEEPVEGPNEGGPGDFDPEAEPAEAPSEEIDVEGPNEGGPGEFEPDSRADDPTAQARVERDEYLALAQRTQADFDNYRKRAAKEIAAAGARAKAEVVRGVLPAVDNLERALVSAGAGGDGLAEGVRLVHADLIGVLERNGVEAIEPGGERFDPQLHEALSTRTENGAEPGVVLDVVQKGYRLDATVLRPARVVVAA